MSATSEIVPGTRRTTRRAVVLSTLRCRERPGGETKCAWRSRRFCR